MGCRTIGGQPACADARGQALQTTHVQPGQRKITRQAVRPHIPCVAEFSQGIFMWRHIAAGVAALTLRMIARVARYKFCPLCDHAFYPGQVPRPCILRPVDLKANFRGTVEYLHDCKGGGVAQFDRPTKRH